MEGNCQKETSAGRQSLHWASPNYVTLFGSPEGWAKNEKQISFAEEKYIPRPQNEF